MRAYLLPALLLTSCAHGGMGQGGGSGSVPLPPVASLPACGFEAPYLPDPCRLEVQPGEWLAISNPKVTETKRHGWLWWLLVAGML